MICVCGDSYGSPSARAVVPAPYWPSRPRSHKLPEEADSFIGNNASSSLPVVQPDGFGMKLVDSALLCDHALLASIGKHRAKLLVLAGATVDRLGIGPESLVSLGLEEADQAE